MADTAVLRHQGMLRLAKAIGARVLNNRGELLARMEDILVDLHDGHVAAAVLSLNSSDKLVAIPLAALTFDPQAGHFHLDVTREMLHNAPSFRSEDWPDLIDRVWAADVYSQFGFPPYWH